MRRSAAALPLVLLATLGAGNGGHAQMRQAYQDRFQGHLAPPFDLPDVGGRRVSLESYRGQVVLLNFWYSSCPPCRKETPDLIALQDEHRDAGFAVLGINLDSVLIPQYKGELLQKFLRTFSIDYPVLIADQGVFEAYGRIPVQPISFLVDRDGVVAHVFWGAFPRPVYERVIGPYLARPLRRAGAAPPTAPGRPFHPSP